MRADLEERFAGFEELATRLEEYGKSIPKAAMAQIRVAAHARNTSALPWLVSLTQVEVLESDPSNFILATMAVMAMAHYPKKELTDALHDFLAQNTVTLPGSKIGIIKIIELLPLDTFAEPLLHQYAGDASPRVRDEAEFLLKRRNEKHE